MYRKLGDLLIQQFKEMEKETLESLKDFDTWKEWKNKL
jgi:phage regulator Rha-like protein